jgi:drug/metabolite transporter (DMT)-like permease
MSTQDQPGESRMETKDSEGRNSALSPAQRGSSLAGGYAIGILAAAVLSLTGILIALVSTRHGVAALVIAFWRDSFTSVSIAAALALFAPRLLVVRRGNIGFLAVNGLVLAGFNILWTLSVVRNGAAAATLLVYSSGGFTVLLGALFLSERVGAFKAAAVAVSLAGSALVSGIFSQGTGNADILGIASGLGSGLAYAVYSLVGKTGSRRGLSPWTSVCYTFAHAALILAALRLLPPSLMPDSMIGRGTLFLPGKPAEAWILLAALAAGPTAIGFGLYNASLGRLPAGTANLIASMEPVFTAVIAYAFLDERLGAAAAAGGFLILAAVVLLWLGDRRSARSPARDRLA